MSTCLYTMALRYSTHCQEITQFYLHTPRFDHKQNEPYLSLPSQPQLVLIYWPRRDGRLSRPWCEVALTEIQTCNLPITSQALYHKATSALERTQFRTQWYDTKHILRPKHGCHSAADYLCFVLVNKCPAENKPNFTYTIKIGYKDQKTTDPIRYNFPSRLDDLQFRFLHLSSITNNYTVDYLAETE